MSLNKLKYLSINDITFDEEENIKINMDNLLLLNVKLEMVEYKMKNYES